MAILMLVFAVYLIYVSYCKIVCLLFKGKQHNRFFAAFLSTIIPVVGSLPAIIIASKYERRVLSPASRMNEDVLRYCIIALQMISVFILFLPFFSADGEYANGVNLIYGYDIAGSDVLKPATFMIYLVVAPFLSAVLNIVDRKFNFHNIFSYWISLLTCLSLLAVLLLAGTDQITATLVFWIHCFINVTVMLLSIFSIVVVRNKHLHAIEREEKAEYIEMQKQKNRRSGGFEPEADTYRCSRCGAFTKKGEICGCITNRPSLDRIMKQTNNDKKNGAKFCMYCKKTLADGEKCDCQGVGFGITVESHPYVGRKCKYCGQQLVGESTCVCEKIMKNSQPVDNSGEYVNSSEIPYSIDDTSNELAALEKKINRKFSDMKNSVVNNETEQN